MVSEIQVSLYSDGESQLGQVSLISSFNLCPNLITHTNNGHFIDSVLKSVGVRAVSYTHLTLPTKLEV